MIGELAKVLRMAGYISALSNPLSRYNTREWDWHTNQSNRVSDTVVDYVCKSIGACHSSESLR